MYMLDKIAVIGDGSWGTTLAVLLYKKGYSVALWGAFKGYIESVKRTRVNRKFLPGIKLPKGILLSNDLKEVVSDSKIVILAVPSQFMRKVLKKFANIDLSGKIIVSATKGIEVATLKRMSELICESLGKVKLAVLSGPTIAQEVAMRIPTTAVIGSKNIRIAKLLQNTFATDRFRVYTSSDLVGVELGGSLKNIIAIACGISDGLGFGANTKAAILSRGLIEISRLGNRLGAAHKTFSGISGLGDLVTTCISKYSRNRFVGEEIGRGKKLKQVLDKMDMVAEGVKTTKSVYRLSLKHKVEMPITAQVYNVLYKNKSPLKAVNNLMSRKRKKEFIF